jgi:predicted anti-sigma-YlaC factor YlaD
VLAGTKATSGATNTGVNCETVREAISARLDDEPAGVGVAVLEDHLSECTPCREWREEAHEVTRRMRLAIAGPAPLAPETVLRATVTAEQRASWRRPIVLTRILLVAVALGQVAVTVPALVFGSDAGVPIHVAHEMGSFDMALAVGFLVAAWRPERAQGMRGFVGAAALLLIVTAVIDLLGGRTTPADEAPHLLAVAGWVLLGRLAALTPSSPNDQPISLLDWVRHRVRASVAAAPGPDGGDQWADVVGTESVERAQLRYGSQVG